MKRVVYFSDDLMVKKYLLQDSYKDVYIYAKVTPSGYVFNQSWLMVMDGFPEIQIESYNNYLKKELYDIIDDFYENGAFGLKVFKKDNGAYVVHPNGDERI